MNLIICTTPLHVLIAEQIIKLHSDEDFCGVYVSHLRNEKFDYYYTKLSQLCTSSHAFILDRQSRFDIYVQTIKLILCGCKCRHAQKVFLASIDMLEIHLLMVALDSANIYTFDDGTINLCLSNFQKGLPKNPGKIHVALSRLVHLPTAEEIISRSQKHYTLYDLPNVIQSQKVKLSLFSKKNIPLNLPTDLPIKRVFLGQPIYGHEGIFQNENKKITEHICQYYQIQYYFPHPKEKYTVNGVTTIKTPMVFEEYILHESMMGRPYYFEVYSFCSTSVLNLRENPFVTFTLIRIPELEIYRDLYSLFEGYNIPIIDINTNELPI